jgi:glutamate-ammonia-ligase adenylyltransferase
LLVSSLDAYAAYQRDAAWTWEQQSLVRARFIAGDNAIAERFREIRVRSLTRATDPARLRREVCAMREKMRGHLLAKDPYVFDLKQGLGGIADIEFLVQYAVLANAHSHPGLVRWTDTVRLLEGLRDVGFLAATDAEYLRQAYCHLRQRVHHCALQELPPAVGAAEDLELRERVQQIWRDVMEA